MHSWDLYPAWLLMKVGDYRERGFEGFSLVGFASVMLYVHPQKPISMYVLSTLYHQFWAKDSQVVFETKQIQPTN